MTPRAAPTSPLRLLAGPPAAAGAESLADHRRRLGPLPDWSGIPGVIPVLEASGLLGRGGAGFPVGRKWRTVAERRTGRAVVLANGAEGEPLSHKDRALMALRPHVVIDGALLAAGAVGADEVILYVGAEHRAARTALSRALAARASELLVPVRLVAAPPGYVSGEESAAVHFVNSGDARPTTVPPRVFERGVAGAATLVNNVESLANAALIGRFGDAWYRAAGSGQTRGTALVTVGAGMGGTVREIELGSPLAQVIADAGAHGPGSHGAGPHSSRVNGSGTLGTAMPLARVRAILLGGYFGGWVDAAEARGLTLDPVGLRAVGRSFGCGVVSVLPDDACGVIATARIMAYMAGQSARQCGPCVFGLGAIAGALERLATGNAARDDLGRVARWAGMIAGRGACRHPDGAVGLVQSALRVFGDEFEAHRRGRRCTATARASLAGVA